MPSAAKLSAEVEERLCAAASVLGLTPDLFVRQLLTRHSCSLGGLPTDIVNRIFSWLDYTSLSIGVMACCQTWRRHLSMPSSFAARLRQVHGVHMIDPVKGMFFFPRALKRVNTDSRKERTAADDSGIEPSTFLTVDVRTQDTRSLPWVNVRRVVQQAVDKELLQHGCVISPEIMMPKTLGLTQAAVVHHDRMIYIFGGETHGGIVLGSCFAYCPISQRWSILPSLQVKRSGACAVAHAGRVYIFGGCNADGDVLDTYEIFHLASRTWERHPWPVPSDLSPPSEAAVSSQAREVDAPVEGYRMPSKVCGAAAIAYDNFILIVGGTQYRMGIDVDTVPPSAEGGVAVQTDVSSLEAATPAASGPHRTNVDASPPTVSSSQGLRDAYVPPLSHEVTSGIGHLPYSRRAETLVWVFCPRSRRWWTLGPQLPEPRALGGLAVLRLPVIGTCLCYFGGCSRSDAPETGMLYIPLLERDGPTSISSQVRQRSSAYLNPSGIVTDNAEVGYAALSCQRSPIQCTSSSTVPRSCHVFRNRNAVWKRFPRVPLGGPYTSVVTIGSHASPTVVLCSSYPGPFIGFCKVSNIMPIGTLKCINGSPMGSVTSHERDESTQRAPINPDAYSSSPDDLRSVEQQQNEVQHLIQKVASAASSRRLLHPTTAGHDRSWVLAPIPEVRVHNHRGHPTERSTPWSMRTLNAKIIVAFE